MKFVVCEKCYWQKEQTGKREFERANSETCSLQTPLFSRSSNEEEEELAARGVEEGREGGGGTSVRRPAPGRAEPAEETIEAGGGAVAGRQTLEGSFSAVSKPNFASKYAFESSRRDLHDALLCTALKAHKIC